LTGLHSSRNNSRGLVEIQKTLAKDWQVSQELARPAGKLQTLTRIYRDTQKLSIKASAKQSLTKGEERAPLARPPPF